MWCGSSLKVEMAGGGKELPQWELKGPAHVVHLIYCSLS